MPTRMKSNEYLQALYDGVNVEELAKIFHKDPRTIRRMLRNCEPAGERYGSKIWRIGEAAPYLVAPVVDVEEYIKKLRPNDLPPLLSKEFWNGKLARQKFEENEGNLWPTESVLAAFSITFKNLRSGIMLQADAIEAQTEFSPRQRQLLRKMSDGLIADLQRRLVDGEFEEDVVKPKKTESRVPDGP